MASIESRAAIESITTMIGSLLVNLDLQYIAKSAIASDMVSILVSFNTVTRSGSRPFSSAQEFIHACSASTQIT